MRSSFRKAEQGFSLIELMIAMVIGLVVMGAVYAAYLASASSTRSSRAVAQMTEDATVAINILRLHVAEAAYSRPVAAAGSGTGMARAAGTSMSDWLIGCDHGFSDLGADIQSLTCNATAPGTHNAVAVAYEATAQNSVLTANAAGVSVPSDCLGAALDETPGAYPYYYSYSRFYLNNNALYCRGPGSASGQALVENIEDMQIKYGVGAASGADATRVVTYKTATEVAALGPWSRVLSVRVCLIVRSEELVMDAPMEYQGCDPFSAKITATDRRMYRAFTSTIVVHNRMGVPA